MADTTILQVGTQTTVLKAGQCTEIAVRQGPTILKAVQGIPASFFLTEKGDLMTQDGAVVVRLPVGADGQYLKANSATTEGIEWDTFDADDLATAAPAAVIQAGDAAIEGTATTILRSDAQYAVETATPTATINAGDAAAEGAGTGLARASHQHAVATATPVAIGTVLSEGVSTSLARADHVHTIPVSALPAHAVTHENGGVDEINVGGLSGLLADEQAPLDHAADHNPGGPDALATAIPGAILPDDAAAEGIAASFARSDHTHAIVTTTAIEITDSTNAEGVAGSFSRADHVHAHGVRGGGTLHAVATGATAGFMSAADKTRHDAHLNPVNTANPHLVTSTQAYVAGGGTTTLNTTQDEFEIDGSALAAGAPSTAGPDYFSIVRGAVNVLNTAYNATDFRTTIYSTAINGIDISPDPAVFPDQAIISLTPSHLEFLRQPRVLTAVPAGAGLFILNSVVGLNFFNATLSAFVRFGPTIQYHQDANIFGQGLLFNAAGIFENLPSVAANMSTGLSFVGQNLFRANAQTITMIQVLDFLSQPRLETIAGGILTMTGVLRHMTTRGTLGAGATLTGDRICFTAGAWSTFTGTHSGTNVGLDIENLQSGVLGATGIRSVLTAGAGRFFIEHTGTAIALFGGEVEIDGDLNHDGANCGFYGNAPVAQPAAYTQTFATATRIHAAFTSATLTDSTTGTANTTVVAVPAVNGSGATTAQEAAINDNFSDLTVQHNALRADLDNLKQLVNSMIDDRQADGLAA